MGRATKRFDFAAYQAEHWVPEARPSDPAKRAAYDLGFAHAQRTKLAEQTAHAIGGYSFGSGFPGFDSRQGAPFPPHFAWYLEGVRAGRDHPLPVVDDERFTVVYCTREIHLGDNASFRLLACLATPENVGNPVSQARVAIAVRCDTVTLRYKLRDLKTALHRDGHGDVAMAIKTRGGTYLLPHQLPNKR